MRKRNPVSLLVAFLVGFALFSPPDSATASVVTPPASSKPPLWGDAGAGNIAPSPTANVYAPAIDGGALARVVTTSDLPSTPAAAYTWLDAGSHDAIDPTGRITCGSGATPNSTQACLLNTAAVTNLAASDGTNRISWGTGGTVDTFFFSPGFNTTQAWVFSAGSKPTRAIELDTSAGTDVWHVGGDGSTITKTWAYVDAGEPVVTAAQLSAAAWQSLAGAPLNNNLNDDTPFAALVLQSPVTHGELNCTLAVKGTNASACDVEYFAVDLTTPLTHLCTVTFNTGTGGTSIIGETQETTCTFSKSATVVFALELENTGSCATVGAATCNFQFQ